MSQIRLPMNVFNPYYLPHLQMGRLRPHSHVCTWQSLAQPHPLSKVELMCCPAAVERPRRWSLTSVPCCLNLISCDSVRTRDLGPRDGNEGLAQQWQVGGRTSTQAVAAVSGMP